MATKWNKHTKLVIIWAGTNLLYFGTVAMCFIFVFYWRGFGPLQKVDDIYLLRRFVVGDLNALAAVIMGIVIAVHSILCLVAFLLSRRQSSSTRPLTLFNVSLVAAILATVAVGTTIWFWSLRQVEEYATEFRRLDPAVQGIIQNRLECCGYFNATIEGIFTSSDDFCSADAISIRQETTACVKPLIAYADSTLNSIFTAVYGIAALQCILFLATASLRVDKIEEERFRKIDEKRGHKGGLL